MNRKKIQNKNIINKKSLLKNTSKPDFGNILFSFEFLDRKHELFNLGNLGMGWALDLFDCFKDISHFTIPELLKSSKFQLHPVNWDYANTKSPFLDEQKDFWQFRLNKSKGRVIGFFASTLTSVFYVVWLDAHHNLTNSIGYGKAVKYSYPLSDYELLHFKNEQLTNKIQHLELENSELKKIIED